jgi:hypothetical protein
MRLASASGWVIAAVMGTVAACGSSFSAAGGGGGDSGSTVNDGGGSVDSSTPIEGGDDDSASAMDGTPEAKAPDSSIIEGGSADGGPGEGGPATGVRCGQENACSGATPVCCLGTSAPACAHQECGCNTQLDCASDGDCKLTEVCCIGNVKDANCNAGHFVATCGVTCPVGQSHLCDPNAPTSQCIVGKTCSTSSSDLQSVGLPPAPYGVCE